MNWAKLRQAVKLLIPTNHVIPTQVQFSQPLGNGIRSAKTMCNLSHLARRLSQGQIRIRAIISKREKHPLSQRVLSDFTFSKNQYFPKLVTSFEQKEYSIFTHLSHGNEQNTADRSQERQSFQGSHRVTQAFLYSSKAEIPPTQLSQYMFRYYLILSPAVGISVTDHHGRRFTMLDVMLHACNLLYVFVLDVSIFCNVTVMPLSGNCTNFRLSCNIHAI